MSEWWTYRPSDLLMFSPRIYWRLFEPLNAAAWPAQPMLVAASLAWLIVQWRRPQGAGLRTAAVALGACWALVAWVFLLDRFAPILPAAKGFAVLFWLQALGFATLAFAGGLRSDTRGMRRWTAIALGAWALLGHPLLGAALGRPWQQAEVFGLAPDPTAIGALAFMLLAAATAKGARWLRRALWIVPLAWCVVSAVMLATMGSPQAWVMGGAAVIAVAVAIRR